MTGAAIPAMLEGITVVEFAANGPVPFCAMLLGDLGARVIRIDRPGAHSLLPIDICARGRSVLHLDLKQADDKARCLELLADADALIEGFRPGVMERIGLGPADVARRNPGIVYGRMTGWGQDGPRAQTAGHDINYIALSGALHAMGDPDRPPSPPLNLVGDFGGGALYLAMAIAAALYRRAGSGEGCVIDAAMVDGAASMMSVMSGLVADDPSLLERGQFGLAGAAPNYACYRCADGGFVAIGALEPQFHLQLLELLGHPYTLEEHGNRSAWPALKARVAAIVAGQPRDHWAQRARDMDACLTPVLALNEAMADPHMQGRGVFRWRDGVMEPSPAPRFAPL